METYWNEGRVMNVELVNGDIHELVQVRDEEDVIVLVSEEGEKEFKREDVRRMYH